MRYTLKPNREGWPEEIPLTDGQYGMDFDVIESEIPNDQKPWLREKRHQCFLQFKEKLGREPTQNEVMGITMKPMGIMRSRIPPEMELITIHE